MGGRLAAVPTARLGAGFACVEVVIGRGTTHVGAVLIRIGA
jgi:hypothetical protein